MHNLLNYSRSGLADFLKEIGEPAYRSTQLLQWIHQVGETDFLKMTNLSLKLRHRLAEIAEIRLPEAIQTQVAKDGTHKWLLQFGCGNAIETVFIPEKTRGTLCVSSQVGCGLTCPFCSTGKQGFNRNLTTAEIIGQVRFAVKALSQSNGAHDKKVTNVVMMGMGEPLLNFDNVVPAMDLMMDDFAYGLSKRRVTLSTSGLVPQLEQLKTASPVALAISLHAPTDALRDVLVPINKKYPLSQLMETCRNYFPQDSRRRITFEYVMLKNVNDSLQCAKDLARLLADIPSKINLIPFNPFPHAPYARSDAETIDAFRDYLLAKGFNTTVRRTRGDDIDAACGQLAGDLQDRTSRAARWKQKTATPLEHHEAL